jgi:hypothetical protein
MSKTRLALLLPLLAACASGPELPPSESTPIALFNGVDLAGWHADVPARDADPNVPVPFVVRDGLLVSLAEPQGHLITDAEYADYRLTVEWRWPGEPGNCGVLIHASTPRRLYGMFPQSLEVQLHASNAGDFWCIGEDIAVPDMEQRRGPPETWGVDGDKARRVVNLNEDAEHPTGEWNRMVIQCIGSNVDVWVNRRLVNSGSNGTASGGRIAIQAEGAECEFRVIELTPLYVDVP